MYVAGSSPAAPHFFYLGDYFMKRFTFFSCCNKPQEENKKLVENETKPEDIKRPEYHAISSPVGVPWDFDTNLLKKH